MSSSKPQQACASLNRAQRNMNWMCHSCSKVFAYSSEAPTHKGRTKSEPGEGEIDEDITFLLCSACTAQAHASYYFFVKSRDSQSTWGQFKKYLMLPVYRQVDNRRTMIMLQRARDAPPGRRLGTRLPRLGVVPRAHWIFVDMIIVHCNMHRRR